MHKQPKTKAFTIIEALLALTLITLTVITFSITLIASVNYVRRSLELRNATLILQEQISNVRDLKYSDVQSLGNSFSSADMSYLKNATGAIKKSYYGPSDRITKISFELAWITFDGKPASKYLATLITDHGIDKK